VITRHTQDFKPQARTAVVIDLPHPDKKKNLPSQRSQREPRTKDGGGACGRESPAMTREGVSRKEGNPCSS